MYWHEPLGGLGRVCLQKKNSYTINVSECLYMDSHCFCVTLKKKGRLFLDDDCGIYAVFCECVESASLRRH